MKFSAIVLLLNALITIAFGLAMMFWPQTLFHIFTGDTLSTVNASVDVRAVYGGLSLGLGLWLMFCLLGEVKLGLLSVICAYGGIVLARSIGLLLGLVSSHPADSTMWVVLASEIIVLVLSIIAWSRAK